MQLFSGHIHKSTCELIVKNNLPACYIRPIVYTDYGSIGIIPKESDYATAIAVWEWGSYLGDDGIKNGIRCIISDIMKTPSQAMPSTAKSCANYANSFLAKKKALNAGYDEAILLNRHGHVSEGPGENIFVIKDNTITTPPVSDDVLKGITRDTAIQLARDLGYEVIETSILPDTLLNADECFFTGTRLKLHPFVKLIINPLVTVVKGQSPIKSKHCILISLKVNPKNTITGSLIARRHNYVKEGDQIPAFEVQDAKGNTVTNTNIKGKRAIFYFLPKR